MRSLLSLLLCGWLTSPSLSKTYVYVSCSGDREIACFRVDESSGVLQPLDRQKVASAPGPMGVSPNRQVLYVGLRPSQQVAVFRLAADSGRLSLVQNANVQLEPVYVRTDQTGKVLLLADYGGGLAQTHALDAEGKIQAQPLCTLPSEKTAHAILVDASNRFAFLPHTRPELIRQLRFDAKTGKLQDNSPARLTTPKGTGPRHVWFHPNGKFVYSSNEFGSSTTAFTLEPSGGLTPLATYPTIPRDFDEPNTCADVEATPDGKFLYVSNRGHDSIAAFRIDTDSGKLTPVGQFATEKTPRSFNVDPSGQFLYAAGQGSGQLACYRIDPASGRLNRFATLNVGENPSWVQTVRP